MRMKKLTELCIIYILAALGLAIFTPIGGSFFSNDFDRIPSALIFELQDKYRITELPGGSIEITGGLQGRILHLWREEGSTFLYFAVNEEKNRYGRRVSYTMKYTIVIEAVADGGVVLEKIHAIMQRGEVGDEQ